MNTCRAPPSRRLGDLSDPDGAAFPCADGVFEVRPCFPDDLIHNNVVVTRIMMEQDEAFDPCFFGKSRTRFPGAMTPALMVLVFRRCELGVVDKKVGACGKAPEDGIVRLVAVLVVAGIHDRASRRLNPISC